MYLLFGGDIYYASGGCNDLIGIYADKEEAIATGIAKETVPVKGYNHIYEIEWWHVFCTETMQIVAKSDFTPHGCD